MKKFYCVALYSKGVSYYYNTLELSKKAMVEKGYVEGDVIYLMQLNDKGEYEVTKEFMM